MQHITAIREASWIKHYWRPAIAWQYFAVCLFDFILAPIMVTVYSYITASPLVMWTPLTLQESAFYHLSMGAIIGVSAWSRGQEKISKIINGDTSIEETETSNTTSTPMKK